ncbi:MAG: apolipoprotein N-acyltransferase [Gemmatimonadota bacterium]
MGLGIVPRPGERLLPVASALLLAAAFPPLHLGIPSFVGLVPFAVWVTRLPHGAEGAASAARGGLLLGLVLYGLLLHWIVPALAWVTPLAVPAFLAVLTVLAGLTALFGSLLHRGVHGLHVPVWLALPVTWTAVEWLQGHLPGPLAFPWLGLGTSLTGFPEWVGIAEMVGARGVTFWLALVNGLIVGLIVSADARSRRPFAAVAVLAMVAAAPAGWGAWRAGTLETRAAARLGVVHTSVPAESRRDVDAWHREVEADLDRALTGSLPESLDLLILPEGLWVGEEERASAEALTERLRAYALEAAAPVLFGAYSRLDSKTSVNAALLMEPSGLGAYRYEKRRLVPLVETTALPGTSSFTRFRPGGSPDGDGVPVLRVGGTGFGVLICFEAIFPGEARAARIAGADVLVNLTNDGWFGVEGGSRAALHQHAAHLVMRAIETRAGAARSANGGFSFFVDPVGRVSGTAGPEGSGVQGDTVFTTDGVTFYTRHGDLVGPASALVALLFGLAGLSGAVRPHSRG